MTRSRLKVFEFDEAEERAHTSSQEHLRKFRNSATKIKKPKHNKVKERKSKPSPLDKSMLSKCFTRITQAREKETCNEPIDVDSEDGLDIEVRQKENNNEAIDLEAEGSCGSRTFQDIICNEATDHTTIGMGFSIANHIKRRTLQDQIGNEASYVDSLVTTPCSRNNVSISTISDDDERTEMISSSYASSPKRNEALLRGLSEHGFGRNCHKFYPRGEQDVVAISQREIELLQAERFINDNIIDFYINHLKKKIKPDKRQRFHFFNCFFFRKLADLDKEPFRACEGRAAFERVRKWTKDMNLFEKDYIFIPVNFKSHWSLVVVCHPGEVVTLRDEEVETHPKVPCILHMNSIKGSHRGLKNIFQSYLCELWKEKHGVTAENLSSRFLHLKLDELELPQQENWYDCGLFLLHFVELFLKGAPVNFNPLILRVNSSNFLSKNWFPPIEASRKRAEILEMIKGIFKNGSQEVSPADCSDISSSIQLPNTTEIEIVEDICQSTEQCHVSIPRSVKCTRGSGLFYKGSPGTIAKGFPGEKYSTAACQMNMMPLIEELDEGVMVSGSPEIEETGSSQPRNPSHLGETRRYDSPSTSIVEDSDSDSMQESTGSAYEKEMFLLYPRARQMNRLRRQSSKQI